MRNTLKNAKNIVIKVGTSTITKEDGSFNLRVIDHLAMVISDLHTKDRNIALVSSGAIGCGVGVLGLPARPTCTKEKQAAAAVGQCALMNVYTKRFADYNQKVAQVLLTGDVLDRSIREENARNTFQTLFSWNVIPIVNANDTVSVDELQGGVLAENDSLSAYVALLTQADLVIILSDIDGLYDHNPNEDASAKRIPLVEEITPALYQIAGGTGSNRGTGGMLSKLKAADMLLHNGTKMVIASGHDPEVLYDIIDGKDIGTLFAGKEGSL